MSRIAGLSCSCGVPRSPGRQTKRAQKEDVRVVVQLPFMAKLGFLGLGIMGYPMARNLLRAGHEVALWSHSAAKAQELAKAEKGVFCDTPKKVGTFADCIFLCVGDTEMAKEVILGK